MASNTELQLDSTLFVSLPQSVLAEWGKLADTLGANYTLSPGWTRVTAESHDLLDQAYVYLGYQGDQLAFVLPCHIDSARSVGIPVRSLELVANKVSYHNRPVSSLEPSETLALLVDIAAEQRADLIHISKVADDSDFGVYLGSPGPSADFVVHAIPSDTSPYLSLPPDWEELLTTKSSKFRYKLRRRAKELTTSESMRMRWFADPDDCDELLEAMRIVEDNSWKKKEGISIFDRDHERRYYELLLPFLFANRAVFANAIFDGDLPIAYNLCCTRSTWVGGMKNSFDQRYGKISPGVICMDRCIEHAIGLGAVEFDFLGDAARHKTMWADSLRTHTDYFLYLKSGLTGRIIGNLKNLRARLSRNRQTESQ